MLSFTVPGFVKEIDPPMQQTHLLVSFSAGNLRTMTVGEPGAQGAAVAGTQGVGTPDAAAVNTLQVPKGMMFVIGIWSMIFAVGASDVTFGAVTTSADGVIPDEQVIIAPMATSLAMIKVSSCEKS